MEDMGSSPWNTRGDCAWIIADNMFPHHMVIPGLLKFIYKGLGKRPTPKGEFRETLFWLSLSWNEKQKTRKVIISGSLAERKETKSQKALQTKAKEIMLSEMGRSSGV